MRHAISALHGYALDVASRPLTRSSMTVRQVGIGPSALGGSRSHTRSQLTASHVRADLGRVLFPVPTKDLKDGYLRRNIQPRLVFVTSYPMSKAKPVVMLSPM